VTSASFWDVVAGVMGLLGVLAGLMRGLYEYMTVIGHSVWTCWDMKPELDDLAATI
jgi:hypothetical protein